MGSPRLLLAVCLLAAVVAAMIAWRSGEAVAGATQRLKHAQEQHKRLQAELEAGRALDARLRPALARIQDLNARGIVGPAPHQQWRDAVDRSIAIGSTGDDSPRPTVRATFSPVRPLHPPGVAQAAERPTTHAPLLHPSASRLQLDAELRHEGELLALLSRLETERSAIVVTRGCALDRLRDGEARSRSGTLRAACTFDWLTVAPNQTERAR